jgi:hypothetical protein
MGLMIHSLEGLPKGHHRDYYIYLLDYGWNEPLSNALKANFGRMATLASEQQNAVVIMPSEEGIHFSDEVLSWHSINGDDAGKEDLLPAILVTNRHPSEFKERTYNQDTETSDDLKLMLFPLKRHCNNTTEVVSLIQKIFALIKEGKDLKDFVVTKQRKKGVGRAIVDSLILEPNVAGMGFNFNKLIDYFRNEE